MIRISILTTTFVLSVIASMPSYPREVVFEAYSFRDAANPQPLGFYFWDNGSFSMSGGGVVIEYRVCDTSQDYSCLYTSNRNVTFAIPRAELEAGEVWGFGGFSFKVEGISKSHGDTLFTITAEATIELDKSLRTLGYELDRIIFLYSANRGLLFSNRYFELDDADTVVDSWMFGGGLRTDAVIEDIENSAVLTAEEFQLLRDGESVLPD